MSQYWGDRDNPVQVYWSDPEPHYNDGIRVLLPMGKRPSGGGPPIIWIGMIRRGPRRRESDPWRLRGLTWAAFSPVDGRMIAEGDASTEELAMLACEEALGVTRRAVHVTAEETERWFHAGAEVPG